METAPTTFEIVRAPATTEMESEIRPVLERAMTCTIEDQTGLEAAARDLNVIRTYRKRLKGLFYDGPNGETDRGSYALARDAAKAILSIFNRADERPGQVEKRLRDEQARYILAEQHKREEAAREAQRLAEEEERKRREAEAAEMKRQAEEDAKRLRAEAEAERKRMEAEGASKRELERAKREQEAAAAKAKADAAADIAAMKAAPIAVAAPPPEKVAASGLAIPMVWKATVVDPDAVPRKWLGEVEVSRIERAKTADPSLNVPGVVFKRVPRVTGRGR